MKKSLFYVLVTILLCTIVFTSCKDNNEIIPSKINIQAENQLSTGNLNIAQDDTLTLKAIVDNPDNFRAVWLDNGKTVSSESEYQFIASTLGTHVITLTVTNAQGATTSTQAQITVYGKYRDGVFILNEGNMTHENGSLIFISPKGLVTDSAYYRVNNSFLGNVTQDLYIADKKIYVIAQNGNSMDGDGMLVVADAETLKKQTTYNDELKELSWPTHIAVIGNNVYIRDNKGIYLFNTENKELKFINGTRNAAKNRMAVIGNKVFSPAGKYIYAITDQKVDTITMPGNVSGIQKSYDNNLWVSCTTNPAQISKIDPNNYSIIQTNTLPTEAKVSAGWGATPGISAKGDTIYFSNAGMKIYRHIFNADKTDFMVDVSTQIQNAGIVYNNLAVHPTTGEIYFNTIKGYGWNFLINDITIWNFDGTIPTLKADYKNYTHFPAGIFFTDNFK